jgi:uncharacterized protein (DUF58 family)
MNDSYSDYLNRGSQQGRRFCLLPPRAVPLGLTGGRLGQRTGSSLEFMDHREYQLGDDLRRIDWNAYARSDKLTVKLYREEINPHLDILVDSSRSMALFQTEKPGATLALAAALTMAAANTHFSWDCKLVGERCEPVLNGSYDPLLWEGLSFDYTGTPQIAMQGPGSRLRARGIRFFISDLLWLGEPQAILTRLCEQAGSVCVVQVLARADMEPPSHGNLRLEDSETHEILEVFVDAAVQARYRQRLARHQQYWDDVCRHYGAVFVTLVAEDLLETWDLDALLAKEILGCL